MNLNEFHRATIGLPQNTKLLLPVKDYFIAVNQIVVLDTTINLKNISGQPVFALADFFKETTNLNSELRLTIEDSKIIFGFRRINDAIIFY